MIEIKTTNTGKLHITTESGTVIICNLPSHEDGESLLITDKIILRHTPKKVSEILHLVKKLDV